MLKSMSQPGDRAWEPGVIRSGDRPLGTVRLVGFPSDFETGVRVDELPLGCHSYRDAVARPMRYEGDARFGAIYDRHGRLVVDSERPTHTRDWTSNPRWLPRNKPSPVARLGGRSFFCGHYFPVFGHFLVETLSRFWPDLDYGSFDHLVCYRGAAPPRQPELRIRRSERELLAAIGVSVEKIFVIDEQPVVFDEITVSSPPFWEKAIADRRFLDVHERIANRFTGKRGQKLPSHLATRVYLSRSQLADRKRAALNEVAIEQMMQARGFAIVYPERLPIKRQVITARDAEVIAGCDGSALHLASFARPGTKLLAIDGRAVPNQFIIDQARGLEAIHVLATSSVLGNRSKAWTADLAQVSAALDLLDSDTV